MNVGDLRKATEHLSATTPIVVQVPNPDCLDMIFGNLDTIAVVDFNGEDQVAYLVSGTDPDRQYVR